jgi:hypothetical protein
MTVVVVRVDGQWAMGIGQDYMAGKCKIEEEIGGEY